MVGTYSYPVTKLPVIEAFNEIARREGIKVSPLLMRIIEEYVAKHQEGNPQHLLTKYQDNEDFMGFPAMAINTKNKKKYIKKMPKKMIEELHFHVQEWQGFLQKT